SLALEVPVEEKRQPQTQGELEHGRDRGIDESIPNGGAENAVVQQRDEILLADETAGNADLGVGDGQQHALYERIGDEHPKQHHRQPALVLKKARGKPAPRRLRECSLTDRFAYRHWRFLSGPAPAAPTRLDGAARLRRAELR